MSQKIRSVLVTAAIILGLSLVWLAAHYPVLHYGVGNVPIYKMYVGDEQSPIFGALHMLESKSPLGLRNLKLVYYPPLFSVLSLPAVATDFGYRFLSENVRTSLGYKTSLVMNWTPLLLLTRLISLIFSMVGLYGLWLLFNTRTFNPKQNKWIPVFALAAIALNFDYFIYAGFFRHWIFNCTSLIWQMYCLIKIYENGGKKYWYYLLAWTIFGLGISFIPIFYQIMFLPLFVTWIRAKDFVNLKRFGIYLLALGAAFAVLFAWSPYPYVKLLGFSDTPTKMTLLPSLFYYIKIILVNQPFISLAMLLGLIGAFVAGGRFWRSIKFWIIFLPLFIHGLFFSSIVHSEPRYMMPFVLLMYIACTAFLLSKWNSKMSMVILGLLILETAYQGATVIRWSQLAWNGPKEFEAIEQIRRLPAGSSAVYTENKILGTIHDKPSLKGYAKACTSGDFDMLQYIESLDIQGGLTVDYYCNGKTSSGKSLENYDYVITPSGDELATNYFEENFLRMWTARGLRSYEFKKHQP